MLRGRPHPLDGGQTPTRARLLALAKTFPRPQFRATKHICRPSPCLTEGAERRVETRLPCARLRLLADRRQDAVENAILPRAHLPQVPSDMRELMIIVARLTPSPPIASWNRSSARWKSSALRIFASSTESRKKTARDGDFFHSQKAGFRLREVAIHSQRSQVLRAARRS